MAQTLRDEIGAVKGKGKASRMNADPQAMESESSADGEFSKLRIDQLEYDLKRRQVRARGDPHAEQPTRILTVPSLRLAG